MKTTFHTIYKYSNKETLRFEAHTHQIKATVNYRKKIQNVVSNSFVMDIMFNINEYFEMSHFRSHDYFIVYCSSGVCQKGEGGGGASALNKQLFMPNFTKFCMLPNFLHVVLQEIPYFSTNMDQNGGGVG